LESANEANEDTCACRKSNPDIFVMQSAEDWAAKNTPCPVRDRGESLSRDRYASPIVVIHIGQQDVAKVPRTGVDFVQF